jgi:hypothetical protein
MTSWIPASISRDFIILPGPSKNDLMVNEIKLWQLAVVDKAQGMVGYPAS